MNWIEDFLHECKEAETPDIWLQWSALATISAVVSPNVYMVPSGLYKLKPNLYVILLGRSGLGKNFGISISRELVSMVGNTRVMFGRATIESTILRLATVSSNPDGSIPFKDSRGYLVSSEFAASIHRNNDALTVMTDLYDNPKRWENSLKGDGIETLNNVCLTMLSGANQDMFDMAVEKTHLQGGFLGRTNIIAAEAKSKYNAHVDDDVDIEIDYEKLARHLCRISKLSGRFKWSDGGKDLFKEWYYEYSTKEVTDKTGTVDRLKDNVKKVAMCVALAKRVELVVHEEDLEEALVLCGESTRTVARMTTGQGNSKSAQFIRPILVILMSSPDKTVTRRRMLQKSNGQFNASELDITVKFMIDAGMVELTSIDKELAFQATEFTINQWERLINARTSK